jgi:1-phosphofructokinase
MSYDVLVLSLNPSIDRTVAVDGFCIGELNRAERATVEPGGKGINAARVLKSLGLNVKLFSFAGGENGRRLKNLVKDCGIDCVFIPSVGETRTNIKIIDKKTEELTEINERGAEISGNEIAAFDDIVGAELGRTKALLMAGSLPPGVRADYYALCIRKAKRLGVITLLDADGEVLRLGAKENPDIVKPNAAEAAALTGEKIKDPAQAAEAARSLVRGGIGTAVISLGAQGAAAADKDMTLRARTWQIDAKSPVGAGDSMSAALIYSALGKLPLPQALSIAVSAGTVTASLEGTELCSGTQALECADKVSVDIL